MYDLSGNVWEWCMDNYNTSLKYHTMRGGSWDIVGTALMSSARNANSPDGTGASMGLRIAWSRQDFTS
jgi:formylglycine-generating enzyme required for sulfatase activity